MRLIAYNLMNGGEGRADPIAEVLLGRGAPDVVGLHEATNDAALRRIAARLQMDFVVAESAGGRVAILSRRRILDSANVGFLLGSSMPMLDATIDAGDGVELTVRVAHLIDRDEATRVGGLLAERRPHAMLMSYEPPMGLRVVDGQVVSASAPLPARVEAPIRQLDQVLTGPDVRVVETWAEQDRLAYYASDHLPSGARIEVTP